jgi:hypothetical protein
VFVIMVAVSAEMLALCDIEWGWDLITVKNVTCSSESDSVRLMTAVKGSLWDCCQWEENSELELCCSSVMPHWNNDAWVTSLNVWSQCHQCAVDNVKTIVNTQQCVSLPTHISKCAEHPDEDFWSIFIKRM